MLGVTFRTIHPFQFRVPPPLSIPYLNSDLLANSYILPFLDHIHENTHLLTLVREREREREGEGERGRERDLMLAFEDVILATHSFGPSSTLTHRLSFGRRILLNASGQCQCPPPLQRDAPRGEHGMPGRPAIRAPPVRTHGPTRCTSPARTHAALQQARGKAGPFWTDPACQRRPRRRGECVSPPTPAPGDRPRRTRMHSSCACGRASARTACGYAQLRARRLRARAAAGTRTRMLQAACRAAPAQSTGAACSATAPGPPSPPHNTVVVRSGEGTGRITAAHQAEARCDTPPLRSPVHAQRAAPATPSSAPARGAPLRVEE